MSILKASLVSSDLVETRKNLKAKNERGSQRQRSMLREKEEWKLLLTWIATE